MKKWFIMLLLLFVYLSVFYREIKPESVQLDYCIDGDTAQFIIDKQSVRVRFVGIDTPELNHDHLSLSEKWAVEASDYTCQRLKQAQQIELKSDIYSDQDQYLRYLRWVYVDGDLLQSEIIKMGLGRVYNFSYQFTHELREIQREAQLNKIGLWSDK